NFPATTGVQDVALSPDGTLAASAGLDLALRVWDIKTKKEIVFIVNHRSSARSVAFSPDSKMLLSSYSSTDGEEAIKLHEVATRKLIRSFRGHTGTVSRAVFRPDGKSIVSAGTDGTLRVWDVATGKELLKVSHGSAVNDVAVSPDGRRALTA